MSDSVQPHRRQPTRLPHPWDSPGKNTGVGCHFLLQCMKVKRESEVAQSCPTLSDPMDCSLPGSSVHGIFQARVLEWVPLPSPVWILYYNLFHYSLFIDTLDISIFIFLFLKGMNEEEKEKNPTLRTDKTQNESERKIQWRRLLAGEHPFIYSLPLISCLIIFFKLSPRNH